MFGAARTDHDGVLTSSHHLVVVFDKAASTAAAASTSRSTVGVVTARTAAADGEHPGAREARQVEGTCAGIVLDDQIAVGEPVGRRVAPRQVPGLNRIPDRVGVEEGRGNREQGTEDCKCNPPFLRLRETLDELRRGLPPYE